VANLKRMLRRYLWLVASRELMRSRLIPVQTKVVGVVYLALLMSPFLIGSWVWWLITGKRLPGPLGRWLQPPTVAIVNAFPKRLPADMQDWLAASDAAGALRRAGDGR